ncbi:MAG TPA: hypothetical protein VEU28_02640 [Actinomycetota bacterium]|nr:hypothetical protein [Actinomycetota bacterium]
MPRPCGEFKARWEKRPDKPGVLTVAGECNVAATHRIVLEPSEPPSEDPAVYLLDLKISLPSGKPPTYVENRATLTFAHKHYTEDPPQRVRIVDVNSEDDPKQEWEIPVRVLNQALADVAPDGTKWSKMERPNRV